MLEMATESTNLQKFYTKKYNTYCNVLSRSAEA